MPLPAISYTPSQQPNRSNLDDASDESEDGVDGILSMLRSNNHSDKTPSSSVLREKTPASALSKSGSSHAARDVGRRVKFDPVFDKPSRGADNNSSLFSTTHSTTPFSGSSKLYHTKSTGGARDDALTPTANPRSDRNVWQGGQQSQPKQNVDDTKSSKEVVPESAGKAMREYNKADQYQQSKPNNESYNDMIERIASSQQGIQEICHGIKELQSTVTASARDESTSKSIESLIQGVINSQEHVRW